MTLSERPFISRNICRGEWGECNRTHVGHDADPFDAATVGLWDVFGSRGEVEKARAAFLRAGAPGALTCILGNPGGPGGIQAVAPSESVPVKLSGRVIGRYFEDSLARYCWLGGVLPPDISEAEGKQAAGVFRAMEAGLREVGLEFRDVVRTWFYNDRILDWYGEFNRARTAFFEESGIALMPASTGIGASNLAGAALAAKVFAIRPKNDRVKIRAAESPLQQSAFNYGSAFSRAISVETPFSRSLYISGTASIAAGGETLYPGDPARQIAKTMEVVGAILSAAGMGFSDTTRAIAYFRNPADLVHWRQFCRSEGLGGLPCLEVCATVCRDDLLFEIELDASLTP